METLKKLDEICKKDPRHDAFSVLDPEHPAIFRKRGLDDFHRTAERISLHDGVPEEIRSHFATARNLVVYSWFYYPFNVTAQFLAFVSVEYALRIKTGNRKKNFSKLLKKAVDEKWITDEGFTHPKRRLESLRRMNEGLPPKFHAPDPPMIREYSDVLVAMIPSLRNDLAHGSSFLWEAGASQVRICAELINQLFAPLPKASTGADQS